MYLARETDGSLLLFNDKPVCNFHWIIDHGIKTDEDGESYYDFEEGMELDPILFPEVTFENSPVEVFVNTKEYLDNMLDEQYAKGFDDGQYTGYINGYNKRESNQVV